MNTNDYKATKSAIRIALAFILAVIESVILYTIGDPGLVLAGGGLLIYGFWWGRKQLLFQT